MSKVNTFDQFLLESVDIEGYDMINEGVINDMVNKVADWWDNYKDKQPVVKGQFAEKAKHFNKSDFIRFVKSILPKYDNLKDTKQKSDFLKKIDKYLLPFLGYASLATVVLSNQEQVAHFFESSIGKGGILTLWGISILATIFYKISKFVVSDLTDVKISIEKEINGKKVVVNFGFYYAIAVKNTYRILYNSFVRMLQKYEKEEWAEIEWGQDSYIKDSAPPSGKQHIMKLNFYPEEFVDVLFDTTIKIYEVRKDYYDKNKIKYTDRAEDDIELRKIKLSCSRYGEKDNKGEVEFDERKNAIGLDFYIQQMSNKQILDLAKEIDNLKLEYHEPTEYFSVEGLKKRIERSEA